MQATADRTTSHELRPLGRAAGLRRLRRASLLLAEREPAFRRTARRFSSGPEDAEDAFQRAAEILLEKGPLDCDLATLERWMQTVTRREAHAVRRDAGRRRAVSQAGLDLEALPSPLPGPELASTRAERIADAARQLAELKPQERRALALQAAGLSYAEIQAVTGWTYTKVNRCLAEGRAALRERGSPFDAA